MPNAVYILFALGAVLAAALFGWLLRARVGRLKVADAESMKTVQAIGKVATKGDKPIDKVEIRGVTIKETTK